MTSRTLLTAALAALAAALPARPPNVILILADDMGWRDTGFAGNRWVETPNLDRLARAGAVFSRCYASAPNCAPTRACLLTGQTTPRHGVYTVVDDRYAPGQLHMRVLSTRGADELPAGTRTIADQLREKGYATALFGMWNLGRGRPGTTGSPTGRGFDLYRRPDDLGFPKDAYHDAKGRYLSDALADEAIAWVERQKDKPFFLYFADHSVHEPFDPKAGLLAKYKAKAKGAGESAFTPEFAATIEALDANVGRLMAKIEALGLGRDTILVFTSDNGGLPGTVAPLRGSKGLLYEGGIRVPGFAHWPGTIGGERTIDAPVASIDLAPTLLEAAGAAFPAGQRVDGVSLLPALLGKAQVPARPLFWHFPCYIGKGEPMSLLRLGELKLIHKFAGPTFELYDLAKDPSESRDLAKEQPAKVAELRQMLAKWQADTGAFLADQPNPAFDPAAREARGGGKGGRKGKEAGR